MASSCPRLCEAFHETSTGIEHSALLTGIRTPYGEGPDLAFSPVTPLRHACLLWTRSPGHASPKSACFCFFCPNDTAKCRRPVHNARRQRIQSVRHREDDCMHHRNGMHSIAPLGLIGRFAHSQYEHTTRQTILYVVINTSSFRPKFVKRDLDRSSDVNIES
jgi:hypothetical protein